MPKDTYIPRSEVVDINRAFDKVRKQAEEVLMKIPGVVAVGVGLKEVKGEHERIPCFKVTVSAKRDKKELSQSEVIPAEIFGFPTDVTEIIQSSSGSNSEKYRPLIGGSQIEPSGGARFGTLGCFAKRNSDGKIVAVSNWHVMVSDPNNIDNDRIGQPTHNGCCSCCACNEIGKVSDGRFMTDDMDVAIAVLNGQDSGTIPDDRFLKEILQIGSVGGSVAPQVVPTGAGAPLALETVFKYGRSSDFTKGQITNDNTASTTTYKEFNNLAVPRNRIVAITPLAPYVDYVIPGDSGSVSVNELNQVVALNFGSNATTHNAVAHSIIRATTTLGITILDNSFHDSVAGKEGVLLNTDAGVGSGTSLSENLAELETELLASREGLRIMELFKSHRTELLDLVRHKREVMAAWNRYQGPAYLAHIARNIRREDKPVPVDIKGITMQSLLLKMAAVLQRNGSSSLSTAVSENYLQLMNILSAGKTHQEWNAYLQQLDKMTYA
jgi:hypothetical protein